MAGEMGGQRGEEAEGGGAGAGAAPKRRRRRRERTGAAANMGAGGRREERRKGGEHEHQGEEGKLTKVSEEAGELRSRPATRAWGGAGRFTAAVA